MSPRAAPSTRVIFWLGTLVALATVPVAVHLLYVPLGFNQFMVQRLEVLHGGSRMQEFGRMAQSMYSSGLNALSRRPRRDAPDLDDPGGMFGYVFSWLPSEVFVYPTEAVYYFSLTVDGQAVWGNLGAASLEGGAIDLAYFTVPGKVTRLGSFSEEDGVRVVRRSEFIYDASYGGRTVAFHLTDLGTRPPRALDTLPEEEFVGQVHDESAVKFFLFFNHATASFYYVLNEEDGVSERLDPVVHSLLVGRRTGFVYYSDSEYERKLLIGVNLQNVMLNNYFDGPCDQVPYRARLRDKLHRAYPNTLLGDGIDEHGVLLNRDPWERVAICAFRRYSSISDIAELHRSCSAAASPSVHWTCLTKEWWNTPFWRRMILERLRAEGKSPVPGELHPASRTSAPGN